MTNEVQTQELTKEELLTVKVQDIIKKVLPGFWYDVRLQKSSLGDRLYIRIEIAAIDYNINGVRGQRPQDISLILFPDSMDLAVQMFGGNGGQKVYREPNREHPREKYLAMFGERVPFRKPKPEEKNVLDAIKRFCEAYKETLRNNINVLCYRDIVDYRTLLWS